MSRIAIDVAAFKVMRPSRSSTRLMTIATA
jgi:hypothetical protein